MANGIYTTVNSREELAEMDENRDKMHQVKVWFEKAAIIEAIVMIYLSFASVIGNFAVILGVVYLILLKKKDAKICRTAAFIHLLLAVLIVITSIVYCVSAFTAGASSLSMPKVFSAIVPEEAIMSSEGNQSLTDVAFKSIKIITIINLIISSFMSLLPVWVSMKSIDYCIMHDELKEKNGYPGFYPDIAAVQNKFATLDMKLFDETVEKFTKILTPKKESENSAAMKALVKEAENLRFQKTIQTEKTTVLPQNEQKDLDIDFMPEIDVLPEITDSDDLKKPPSDNSFMEDVKSS